MIFLSSQPDKFYFLWQLQLQLFNFRSLGVKDADIHILLGYDLEMGLSADFKHFIVDNECVNIHAYPDTRKSKLYAPSIRWHIIAKHLEKFPELQKATIFHHDSDIVFKSLPDFDLLIRDDIWYAADSRSYLNSNYIKNTAGEEIFSEMCRVVGVTRELVESADENAGGAQYLLKNLSLEFLIKMEEDSEKMYALLAGENRKRKGFCGHESDYSLIQAWCADMWVIWWCALYFNKKFVIHKELDFAWVDSPIEMLNECKTLHYTGGVDKKKAHVFRKGDYVNYTPFNQDLSKIDQNLCGDFLRKLIDGWVQYSRSKRYDLRDVTFLITVDTAVIDHPEDIYAVTLYLSNNFNTHIIIRELCQAPKIDFRKLPQGVTYEVISNPEGSDVTGHNKQLISIAQTPYIAIWSSAAIVPVAQIIQSISHLRSNQYPFIKPFDKIPLKADMILKEMFIKIQDANLFEKNKNKMKVISLCNDWDAIFINKAALNILDQNHVIEFNPEDTVENIDKDRQHAKAVEGHIFYMDNIAN
jgi:hypothetical protein